MIDYSPHIDAEHLLLPFEAIQDKQGWQQIEHTRHEFLEHPFESFGSGAVRPEILESWIRSCSYGVDPEKSWLCIKITDEEYQKTYDTYERLVDIARPMMLMINELQLSTDYIFELMTRNGVSLYQLGNMNLHRHIASKSIFNEATMGTNAHSLCMHHRMPFMVIGPEHYCTALHNLTACAVPIFDADDNAIAALLFTRANSATPWSGASHKLLSHTIGMITSMAAAIESRLVQKQYYTHMLELKDQISSLQEHQPEDTRAKERALPQAAAHPRLSASAAQTLTAIVDGSVIVRATRPDRQCGDAASVTFNDILGQSDAIMNAVILTKRFAETEENLLIVGESGTGKEYFAQAVHNHSRPCGPFMSINCAAIPHRLIESELFGYEGGTFTGAQKNGKPGKIELAHGGTLFLDEIGDMPLELQATLLRVLENKRVMRLGGKNYKQVDFRVVAATNRDLASMVAEGAFREDLFYRLSILTITLPPLRACRDDIGSFIQHFLDEVQQRYPDRRRWFSAEVLQAMTEYRWPGNIRQLKNAVVSAYHAATDEVITSADLPGYLYATDVDDSLVRTNQPLPQEQEPVEPPSCPLSLHKMEEDSIRAALEKTDYNVARAAELLEISKATLYRKLKEYHLTH